MTSTERDAPEEQQADSAGDDGYSLRERVADASWRQRVAANAPLNSAYRGGVGVVGFIILIGGAAAIPLPGPGWLIVIGGLFVLATEFTWAERLLEFTKKHVKSWTDWVTRQPIWARAMIGLATAAFVYGVLVVSLHLTGVPDWIPDWVPLWR
ncbi:MAG: TIGR02611 family protein [Geodermatophilaceae bacterium]|nr:TIGR02611 family protein [Geodermatophilaceae bacterium]